MYTLDDFFLQHSLIKENNKGKAERFCEIGSYPPTWGKFRLEEFIEIDSMNRPLYDKSKGSNVQNITS